MIKKLLIFAAVIILMLSVFVVNVSAYDCGLNGHEMVFGDFVLPTCTTQGYEISRCKYCDYKTYSNYVPSLGHSFINGTCSTCGEIYTSHTHSYVATVIKNATCTSNGIKKYQCSDTTCGDSYTVTIYATGHKMVYSDFVNPTCTTQGYEISLCMYCDYQKYSNYVEPLGHDFSGLYCSKCGYQREIDCSVEGHEMVYSNFVNPTCTTQGYEISRCKYCGYETYSNYVDALKHSYSYVVIIEPTCKTFGAEQLQCECGAKGDTRTIAKLNHSYFSGECTNCGMLEGQNPNIPRFPNVDITKYSFVMDDLNKDSTFDTSKYPVTASEHTINVFQVAESSSGQLFLYVYNPITNGIKLDASYINMSTEIYESKNPTYKFYSLTKLSESEQFTKYLVNDFKVKSASSRYYNIVCIYTPYNAKIHEPAKQSDDIKNYVGVPVAKCFQAVTKNNVTTYCCMKIDYVDVDISAVGFIRYPDEIFPQHDTNTDAHFIAFKANNFDVKKVYDATVYYSYHTYYLYADGSYSNESIGKTKWEHLEVKYDEVGSNEGGGFLGLGLLTSRVYTWNRIMTIEEFQENTDDLKNGELHFVGEDALSEAQFVIRYLETPYTYFYSQPFGGALTISETKTVVEGVTILRLKFATPEGVFNLGVVADIVSDDGKPDFEVTPETNVKENIEDIKQFFGDNWDTIETILAIFFIVALVVVIILLVTYFKSHSLSNAYVDVLKVLKGKKHNRSKRVYRNKHRSYERKSYKYKKGKKYYVQKPKRKTRVQTRYKKRS